MPRLSNSFSSMAVKNPAFVALKEENAKRTVSAAKALAEVITNTANNTVARSSARQFRIAWPMTFHPSSLRVDAMYADAAISEYSDYFA
jgi:hypothetical protein